MVARGIAAGLASAVLLPGAAAATPLAVAPEGVSLLQRLDSSAPLTRTNVTITPASTAATRGIDWRRRTGDLVLLTNNSGLDALVLTPGASSAALRNSGSDLTGTAPFEPTSFFGVDVHPTADRVRAVQSNDNHFRLHPDSGALTPDTPLTPTTVAITGVAYTPGDAPTLYGIDHVGDQLVRIGGPGGNPSANSGEVTPVGPLGVSIGIAADLDIGQDGVAWASLNDGSGAGLYRIDLVTGAASLVGSFGPGSSMEGLSVLPAGVLELDGITPVTEGDSATVTVRRRDGAFGAVSVRVDVADGSASSGDLDRSGGVVTFAEAETTKTFTIATTEDGAAEAAEDAVVRLSQPAGGAIVGAGDEAAIVIRDDDTPAPAPVTTTTTTTQTVTTPGPLVIVEPPRDRVAPFVIAVPPDRIRLRTVRSRGLPFILACAEEACTVTAQLQDGRRVLGTASARFGRPSSRRVRLRLSRAGRRALRAKRLTLRLRAVDASGNVTTTSVGVRVTR